ncbi:MAG: hypothetical protein QXS54_10465 [Candidatus Methanomethylicaceae archaeon]
MNVSLLSSTVGWGQAAIDVLGYRCRETQDRIVVLGAPQWVHAISAHAPSRVTVNIDSPCAIVAATNASFRCEAPITAWIDHHHVATLTRSSQRGPAIHVPPGQYLLKMETSDYRCAHTVWLIYESPQSDKERLAVITIGAFPEAELSKRLQMLFRSCALRGLLVLVAQVGEQYQNHYTNKIVRLTEYINRLPEVYEYILYIDGLDGFLLANENEIRSFLEETRRMVIGAEDCCWPLRDDDFRNRFAVGTHRFLNAGCWAGHRSDTLNTLSRLTQVREDIVSGKLQVPGYHPRMLTNDQFIWQVAYLERQIDVDLDTEWQFVANLPCTWMYPTDNNYFVINGTRLYTHNGTKPKAVHLPGRGKSCKHLWWGLIEQ